MASAPTGGLLGSFLSVMLLGGCQPGGTANPTFTLTARDRHQIEQLIQSTPSLQHLVMRVEGKGTGVAEVLAIGKGPRGSGIIELVSVHKVRGRWVVASVTH